MQTIILLYMFFLQIVRQMTVIPKKTQFRNKKNLTEITKS
jgi:hypothetical protein